MRGPRRPSEIVGDVTDGDVIAKALAGAEGAYLMLPPDNTANDELAKNRRIVDHYAAGLAAAKVPHAVFLSSVGSQLASGNGPVAATHYGEVALAKSATKLTFVRAAFFMENMLANASPMKSDGVLPVFGGGEAIRSRWSRAATSARPRRPRCSRRRPPPNGSSFTARATTAMSDAAAVASQILGRGVKALRLPIEQMVPTLTKLGFSENIAGLMREMTEASARASASRARAAR